MMKRHKLERLLRLCCNTALNLFGAALRWRNFSARLLNFYQKSILLQEIPSSFTAKFRTYQVSQYFSKLTLASYFKGYSDE